MLQVKVFSNGLYDFDVEDSGVVYGCTNPAADNYDVTANTDNGRAFTEINGL